MPIVEATDVSAHYITNLYGIEREVSAVDNVSLSINKNEIVGICGESGCGKTTLLKVLFKMIYPPLKILGGKVEYNLNNKKLDILTMSDEVFNKYIRWKNASYIPQGSMNVLNPVIRIKSTFRDFLGTHCRMGKREIDEMTLEYLNDLGLPPQVMDAYPHQLSGGMRQRITIALATILKPDLVFADEPTTALDVIVQRGVIQLMRKIQSEEKLSLVIVTHDMSIHANLTDRIAIMYAGKIIEEGKTKEIFKNPMHYYTQFLINSLPKIGDKSYRISIPGGPPPLYDFPSGCRFYERCPEAEEHCKQEIPPMIDVGDGHKVACFKMYGK